jgi:uncharacterized protein with ATP-grasp and redox domains
MLLLCTRPPCCGLGASACVRLVGVKIDFVVKGQLSARHREATKDNVEKQLSSQDHQKHESLLKRG